MEKQIRMNITRKDYTYIWGKDCTDVNGPKWKMLKINMSPPPGSHKSIRFKNGELNNIEAAIKEMLRNVETAPHKRAHIHIFVNYKYRNKNLPKLTMLRLDIQNDNPSAIANSAEPIYYVNDITDTKKYLVTMNSNAAVDRVKELVQRCNSVMISLVDVNIKVVYSYSPIQKICTEEIWLKAAEGLKLPLSQIKRYHYEKNMLEKIKKGAFDKNVETRTQTSSDK